MIHPCPIVRDLSGLTNGKFYPDPSKQAVQVLFSRKTSKIAHPEIFYYDTEVKNASGHKHLGLTLDTKTHVCFSYR